VAPFPFGAFIFCRRRKVARDGMGAWPVGGCHQDLLVAEPPVHAVQMFLA
jgi:hypothetical protein